MVAALDVGRARLLVRRQGGTPLRLRRLRRGARGHRARRQRGRRASRRTSTRSARAPSEARARERLDSMRRGPDASAGRHPARPARPAPRPGPAADEGQGQLLRRPHLKTGDWRRTHTCGAAAPRARRASASSLNGWVHSRRDHGEDLLRRPARPLRADPDRPRARTSQGRGQALGSEDVISVRGEVVARDPGQRQRRRGPPERDRGDAWTTSRSSRKAETPPIEVAGK